MVNISRLLNAEHGTDLADCNSHQHWCPDVPGSLASKVADCWLGRPGWQLPPLCLQECIPPRISFNLTVSRRLMLVSAFARRHSSIGSYAYQIYNYKSS